MSGIVHTAIPVSLPPSPWGSAPRVDFAGWPIELSQTPTDRGSDKGCSWMGCQLRLSPAGSFARYPMPVSAQPAFTVIAPNTYLLGARFH